MKSSTRKATAKKARTPSTDPVVALHLSAAANGVDDDFTPAERRSIAKGKADLRAGRVSPSEDVYRRLGTGQS